MIPVPYPNLALSAASLIDAHLFELMYTSLAVLQVDSGVQKLSAHWAGDYRAWRRYQRGLLRYHNTAILEWTRRGYAEVFTPIRTVQDAEDSGIKEELVRLSSGRVPLWVGWPELHAGHRGSLCRRELHYRRLWSDDKKARMVVPGEWPSPGQFLVKDDLIGLVMELKPGGIELLVKGHYKGIRYEDVERNKWVRDILPVHERLRLEFGDRTADQQHVG